MAFPLIQKRKPLYTALVAVGALGCLGVAVYVTVTKEQPVETLLAAGSAQDDFAALSCTETDHAGFLLIHPDKAREELYQLNQLLKENPSRPDLLARKVHLAMMVDTGQAVEACREILARSPKNSFALGHLAAAYVVQGRLDSALQIAATLEGAHPGPEAWNMLGSIFLHQGNLTQAERWFKKTLDREPNNIAAQNGMSAISEKK